MTPPWIVVAGDFVRTGGMDAANHALASWLARSGREVHLVAHRVADDLAAEPGVRVHRVPRPLGAHALGFPLLDFAGRRVARSLAGRDAVVVANGGNCGAGDVAWLHYVHAAYAPEIAGRPLRRLGAALVRRAAMRDERRVAPRARVVIANSWRTASHAAELLGADADRVAVVYYGVDADRFRPPTHAERAAARRVLAWDERPTVAFVGALGDRRKGFDALFAAWTRLCADPAWDARLAVAGAGGELGRWTARAAQAGLGDRIAFLGFQRDVRTLLRVSDAVASPTRYEAYGLAVHEALCCGLAPIVSEDAGVAERIPPALAPLLLPDPDDVDALVARLRAWRGDVAGWRRAAGEAGDALRRWTWDDMAAAIARQVE